ncbi:cyclic peptide export ABC transporter [Fulvivirga kasyanovii]|uniref:cyclic peptide export ABC transporter n=1 Tax=Fulvivirga kasyanovii TaxID=396812 RepID=UPI0031CF71EA
MEFLKLLFNRSRSFYVLLILLSAVNAALNTGLLMFINNAITQEPLPYFPEYDWMIFTGIILVSIICNRAFQTYMINLTNDILFDFELKVLHKLRFATYESFEKLGKERVFTAIGDTRAVGNFPEVFLNAFKSAIITVCCFAYLFWISPIGGGAILLLMFSLLVFYIVRNSAIEKDLNILRDLRNDYFRYLNDFLHGFKEVKMSLTRSSNIYNKFLQKNRLDSKGISVNTSIKYMNNELVGSYSWYIVLGAIIFLLPKVFGLDIGQTTAFIVTILYMIGPIAVLITLVPTYTNVKIAIQRLNQFNELTSLQEAPEDAEQAPLKLTGPVSSIKFENVTYDYFDKARQQTFHLGPLNVDIEGGNLIFLTGGNGSGKSTFVNLLTGLYRPTGGAIYLNGVEITNDNYVQYRDNVSAIFTNNYLFSDNYDDYDFVKREKQLAEYVAMMKLSEVLRINVEEGIIDSGLSKGQQKRLALIYALLEDNPVIVLDEWAAEQDPQFRAYFYKELLPRFKAQGKTIIAVTHDDEYYTYADRVIKFNFGKIVKDQLAFDLKEELNTL